jgi:putative ABC transport system substrate-binding protein
MRRREFLGLVGGAAAWPLSARAQPAPGRPLLGVLIPGSAITVARNIEVLRATLGELGYIEGRNIWLEIRYANGVLGRLPGLAVDLVSHQPDVIIAASSPGVVAAHRATRTIPIVMNSILDPVALGVVKSIPRPGGNVTGIWLFGGNDALIGKRIALLKEIVPNLSRIAVMAATGDQSDEIAIKLIPAATSALGVTAKVFHMRTDAELDAAFAQAVRDGMQGAFVNQSPFFFTRRTAVAALAARAHLPAVYGYREHTEGGGLMSYGSSLSGAYVQIARLVDKILKGAKPADLPVEQADKFELVVNNKTARALGLQIPESFLLRADQVIE